MSLWSNISPINKAFLEAPEKAICKYIERLQLWKMSVRPQMVERTANHLLFFDSLNHVVGPHGTRQFFDCQPEYFKCKQKSLSDVR